ncbi:hypothetical protein Btru_005424 [Bulinus truncatus]|nr:hypothetical protein Btru_005424 [Bulinus truncatus]
MFTYLECSMLDSMLKFSVDSVLIQCCMIYGPSSKVFYLFKKKKQAMNSYLVLVTLFYLVHSVQAGETKKSVGQLRIVSGPCSSAPCLNAGSCIVTSESTSSYSCVCLHGFTGLNCELGIDECASSPCIHGACVDNIGSFRCICFPGYQGPLCDVEVDLCASVPCRNGGRCVQTGPGHFRCECRVGYRGMTCETDIDECLSLSPCQHGGSCTQGLPGTYVCVCQHGYTGTDCETSLVNVCGSNPCQNGGQCVPEVAGPGFQCLCRDGYVGHLCHKSTDVCASNPCGGNARCQRADSDRYYCDNCSVSDCQDAVHRCVSHHCHNNGTCFINESGNVSCVCPRHFTGDNCETRRQSCDKVTCYNGGSCHLNTNGNSECMCTEGFHGNHCEYPRDICSTQPCHNNGTCRKSGTPQGFLCHCLPQYAGQTCQFVNMTGNSTSESPLTGLVIFRSSMDPTLLLSLLGILLALGAIIGVSAFIIRLRDTRRPEDFCFTLPQSFYQRFNPTGSLASSGRFQNTSILDYDEFVHAPSAFRY